jgi:hypothetical protein
MKWFAIQSKSGRDSYEYMLYSSSWERQIWLPYARQLAAPGVRYQILRAPVDPSIKRLRWDKRSSPTREDFAAFVNRVCQLVPEHAETIRALPPGSHIGHLMLTRTGPACPEIDQEAQGYVVREQLKRKLEWVPAIDFFPAYPAHIVPLNWELGEPVPKEFEEGGDEPESYILNGKHSHKVAAQMGKFFEVVLPPAQSWYPIARVPPGTAAVRVAFEGSLPCKRLEPSSKSGLVEFAVGEFEKSPWFCAIPAEQELRGVYHFVREDVAEVLREPGKWTLEFKEVEQF